MSTVKRTLKILFGSGLLLLCFGVTNGYAEASDGYANPCLDQDSGLLCPDLVMRRPYGLHLVRTAGGRRLLASTNAIVNEGLGPLEIKGRRTSARRMKARQLIRARKGFKSKLLPASGTIAFFDTRSRGQYWKFKDAARFELWKLDADGNRTKLVRTGPKIYYCYRDLRRLPDPKTGKPYARSPRRAHFGACKTTGAIKRVTLGTSVGWADIYPWSYPQNWIDVGGLRGCFAYVHRADPKNHFAELREDNNYAARRVRLPWRGAKASANCPKIKHGEPDLESQDTTPDSGGTGSGTGGY